MSPPVRSESQSSMCHQSVNVKIQKNKTKQKQRGLLSSISQRSCKTYTHCPPLLPSSSLPLCKALFISPCLLHVDMENILGWNSNDSYIHTLLCSVFVFKLHFSPNRVYKPCLGRGDHSLPYCLESERHGILHYFTKTDMLHFYIFSWKTGMVMA